MKDIFLKLCEVLLSTYIFDRVEKTLEYSGAMFLFCTLHTGGFATDTRLEKSSH